MRSIIEGVLIVLLMALPFWVYPLLWVVTRGWSNKGRETRPYGRM